MQTLQQQLACKPLYLPGAAVRMQIVRSRAEYLYELPVQLTPCMIQAKDRLLINVAVSGFQQHIDCDVALWHEKQHVVTQKRCKGQKTVVGIDPKMDNACL